VDADLLRARLDSAIYDSRTVWPTGFDPTLLPTRIVE
jgi:hypothetical protein